MTEAIDSSPPRGWIKAVSSGTDFIYFLEQMQADDKLENIYEKDGVILFEVR